MNFVLLTFLFGPPAADPIPPVELEPVEAPASVEASAPADDSDAAPVEASSSGESVAAPVAKVSETRTETSGESESDPRWADLDAPSEGEQPAHTPKAMRGLRLGKDSLVLGGYIQPGFVYVVDTDFNQDDQDGFDFANARLTGRGRVPIYRDELYLGFNFNFDVNRGNFGVRDVYGTLAWRKDLIALDVGQLKTPFSLALLQSESKLQFAYSPGIRRIAFGRDQGIRLRSEGTVGRVYLAGAAMLANGEGGFRQRRNLDGKFLYTARFEIGPLGEVPLSEPDLDDSKFAFVIAANVGHAPALGKGLGIADVGAKETRVGGDIRMRFRGASLRAEYLHGFRGENGDPMGEGAAFQRYAVNAQAGYVLPIPIEIPRFELVFRYQLLDVNTRLDGFTDPDLVDPVVDNARTQLIEPGLVVYLAGHAAKLMVSYQLRDLLEGGPDGGRALDNNGNPLIGDTVFAFFQFAWL